MKNALRHTTDVRLAVNSFCILFVLNKAVVREEELSEPSERVVSEYLLVERRSVGSLVEKNSLTAVIAPAEPALLIRVAFE